MAPSRFNMLTDPIVLRLYMLTLLIEPSREAMRDWHDSPAENVEHDVL